jgi:molybdate transport system substrate-binding protein
MVLIRFLFTLLLLLLLCLSASAAELSVFAASSLMEPLRELADSYESAHPDMRILLNFSGSQTLATQIELGAPADLFISADHSVMERLQKLQLVESPHSLLSNQLALAVRQDLRPRVSSYQDLARPGLLLAIGNSQVPVGRYTRQLLSGLAADPSCGPGLVEKIKVNVVSEENQVKAILTKLLLGEADAGVVYRSDLTGSAARRLAEIQLPEKHLPHISYPLARVRGGAAQTEMFINYLFGKQAREIFTRYGLRQEGNG